MATVTYDNTANFVRMILKKHLHLLTVDPDLAKHVGVSPQLMLIRSQNLQDKLVHSHFSPPAPTGTWLDRQIKGCFRCSGYIAYEYVIIETPLWPDISCQNMGAMPNIYTSWASISYFHLSDVVTLIKYCYNVRPFGSLNYRQLLRRDLMSN